MDEIIQGFIEEVKELLVQLEDDLIELENNPGNAETINNIFRVMHTLKGSAGMVGFKNIQDLTHEYENLYHEIREGERSVDSEIIDVTLKGKDMIFSMLNNKADETESQELTGLLKEMMLSSTEHKSKRVAHVKEAEDIVVESTEIKVSSHLYVIFFTPDKGIFERGLDPDKILDELKTIGVSHVISHEKKKPWAKQKAEKICATLWEIYLKTAVSISDIEGIFLFYEKEEFSIFEMSPEQLKIDPFLEEKLEKIYKNKIIPEQQVKECIEQLPELQQVLPEETAIEEKPAEQVDEAKSTRNTSSRTATQSTVNVSSQKLDELMNLVSELVTSSATVEAYAEQSKDPRLLNITEGLEKLTKKFRNNALDLRLVPVGTLLNKFKRQVRDLSRDLGKRVNLIIEGQDIEIDKTILKSIESPLQHIIRNSIDHGLEIEEDRIKKGKTPDGLLKITAFYSGANVIIQVQDDGKGIDLVRVRECAINKGLIQEDQTLSKQELINLTLEPGFTTANNVSLVSGRGVGMNVVKKELNSVGGGLEIFTEEDLGTSITMKLPTTLTIIDTLMVYVAETQILIPVMDIEYCYKEKSSMLFDKDNRYVQYKNSPVPLISLHDKFKLPPAEKEELMVIIINKFDNRFAITVDEIVGEHQAVIKPLGELFINQSFFSGGSIMIDGNLAFILDTNFLINLLT